MEEICVSENLFVVDCPDLMFDYPLVIQHSHGSHGPFIDGLPFTWPIKNGGSFRVYVSHNQMVLVLG